MKLASKQIVGPLASYEVLGQLGEGGAGIVYRARRDDGAMVAIKVLKPSAASRERLKRFRNELHFCIQTTDTHIVRVSDFGQCDTDEGTATYYVMPQYAGTLRSVMAKGVTAGRAHSLFLSLLDAVEATHRRNVFHRDLKPENLLVSDGSDALVLSDFGAAHFHRDALLTAVETAPNDRLANFEYAAPEQRRKSGTVDLRSDLYALGLIGHELFTGLVPHGKGHKRVSDVSPDYAYYDEVIDWLTQHEASNRPSSVDEVRIRLIGLGKEAGARLKISAIENAVIPVTKADDPLISDPPRLVGCDLQGHTIHLKLSTKVTSKWVHAFQHTNYHTALMGAGPTDFSFGGDSVTLTMRYNEPNAGNVQQIVNDFKRFLDLGAVLYRDLENARMRREDEEFRRQKEAQLKKEKHRLDLLGQIKI